MWFYLVMFMLIGTQLVQAASRIKDLVSIEGIRENQLVGYGLVVGLNGTGDSLNNSPFTRQSLQAMLERLGVNTRSATLRTANVAAVMVTGNLPPFSTQGTRMDISVSTLGDASNLQGGTLLVTPLHGANGEVFAVAQGPVAIGGFSAEGAASSITRGVPTSGRIANGAIIERELNFKLKNRKQLRLSLHNPDFTTAKRISVAINAFTAEDIGVAINPSTVLLTLPKAYSGNIITLLTEIEQLRIEPDTAARVIIDEQTGIIVMGSDVKVSRVAISQGNLTISVSETPEVSQPEPLAPGGATVVVPRTAVQANTESGKKLAIVESAVDLKSLVNGLNALGIGPRDMISILQAIKAAGALQADIEVM
ncbi:MAG: flagellar basal body P-ring protein FlgI [Pseudomonadota bacterium]